MRRVLGIIAVALAGFIILKATTLGWRFWGKSAVNTKNRDSQDINSQLAGRLKSHVYRLAGEIGERSVFRYDSLKRSAEYITQALESFGYDLILQDYNVSDKRVENIIAAKKGIRRPGEIIIVGAHYDTCFNPGADDNASAVAVLIELARLMSGRETNRTIRFIGFVNEEPPFFKTKDMGSRVYAKAAGEGRENIKAVLILESVGYYSDRANSQRYPPLFGLFYPNKANFIAVVGNFKSRRLIKEVVSGFKNKTGFPVESVATFGFIPGVDFSDHWSFWKEGFSAVMITDTAFYRNPGYHSGSDTCEKLDYDSMAEVTGGLAATLIELSK